MATILTELVYKVNDKAIKQVEKSAKDLEKSSKGASLALKGIGIGIAAVAAAGAAFAASAKKTLVYADALAKTADNAGISIERLQELRYAGELMGVTTQQMDAAVKAFANRLGKDLTGMGGAATKSLEQLGIAQRIASGELKTTEQIMNATIKAVENLGSENERTAHLTNLFGDEVGKNMTVLVSTKGALEDLTAEAHRLGVVMDEETVRKAEAANDAFFRLGEIMRVHTMSSILDLMPHITDLVNTMIDHRQDIIDFANGMFEVARAVGTAVNYVVDLGQALGMLDTSLEEQLENVEKALAGGWDERLRFFGPEGIIEYYDEQELQQIKKDIIAKMKVRDDAALLKKGDLEVIGGAQANVPDATGRSLAESWHNNHTEVARRAAEEQMRIQEQKFSFIQRLEDEAAQRSISLMTNDVEQLNAQTEYQLELLKRRYDEELKLHQYTADEKAKLDEAYANNVSTILEEQRKKLDELSKNTILNAENMGRALENSFERAILDGEDFGDVLNGLIRQLAQMALQQAMAGMGKAFFSFLGFADGGVFQGGKVTPFADGGVVNRPTLFPMADGAGLMGEAGPEAIMPLKRGPGGRLGVEASGGGRGVTIGSINVSVQGGNTNEETGNIVAQKIEGMLRNLVNDELRNQMRPGNMLRPAAMTI